MSSSSHIHDFNDAEFDELLKNKIPSGFRFKPSDKELILGYLLKKISNEDLPANRFKSIQLYDYNPETLTEKYKAYDGEDEWYFFTPTEKISKNGSRPNRKAGDGFWKATVGETKIYNGKKDRKVIGYKRTLVFYYGTPTKGVKTNWIMHEYLASDQRKTSNDSMKLHDWVLCRIHLHKGKPSSSSSSLPPNVGNKRSKTVMNGASSSSDYHATSSSSPVMLEAIQEQNQEQPMTGCLMYTTQNEEPMLMAPSYPYSEDHHQLIYAQPANSSHNLQPLSPQQQQHYYDQSNYIAPHPLAVNSSYLTNLPLLPTHCTPSHGTIPSPSSTFIPTEPSSFSSPAEEPIAPHCSVDVSSYVQHIPPQQQQHQQSSYEYYNNSSTEISGDHNQLLNDQPISSHLQQQQLLAPQQEGQQYQLWDYDNSTEISSDHVQSMDYIDPAGSSDQQPIPQQQQQQSSYEYYNNSSTEISGDHNQVLDDQPVSSHLQHQQLSTPQQEQQHQLLDYDYNTEISSDHVQSMNYIDPLASSDQQPIPQQQQQQQHQQSSYEYYNNSSTEISGDHNQLLDDQLVSSHLQHQQLLAPQQEQQQHQLLDYDYSTEISSDHVQSMDYINDPAASSDQQPIPQQNGTSTLDEACSQLVASIRYNTLMTSLVMNYG